MTGVPAGVRIVEADLADEAHRRAIVEMIDSYARDPMGGGAGLAADVRERLPDVIATHPTAFAFLALAGEEPVGVATCVEGLSTFRARRLVNVHDLGVVPAWRGRGVGRALLAAVEERARERDCCRLTLEVLEPNERARGLYASFGFSDFVVGGPTRTLFLSKELDG